MNSEAVKKARENKKEQVEAEARALAKEKQVGAMLKPMPTVPGSLKQPKKGE